MHMIYFVNKWNRYLRLIFLTSSISFAKMSRNVLLKWFVSLNIILSIRLFWFLDRTICVICFGFALFISLRYPNGVPFINKMGMPCLLRSDLRSSFLSYFSRMTNRQIRRYEIGPVTWIDNSPKEIMLTQYTCSIDNIWLQRFWFIGYFTLLDKMIWH